MFFELEGKRCWAEPRGEPEAVVLLLAGEYSRETAQEITDGPLREGNAPAFVLAGAETGDWDGDYSPWPFTTPGGRHFSGGADSTGTFLREALLPYLQREFPGAGEAYLVGYSMGGLAALYLFCQGGFAGCGSCSGSLWYPGCTRYLQEHPAAGRVYLSLGGKEKNTKDPLMCRVEEETLAAEKILSRSARTAFVREPGGHFRDIPGRLARAVSWLLLPQKA